VINDADVDFGEIVVPESVSVVSSLPSVRVDPTKLEHLSSTQRTELLQLLDKYEDRFADRP